MNVELLLRQHVGAPCNPVVNEGEEVKKGQLIAEPNGLGANIHSSVYGKITKITSESIIIDAYDDQPEEYVKLSETDDKLELIKEAGVVGAGGAGFPTHIKLNIDLDGGYMIANAAECEPDLKHNIKLVEEDPDMIVRGVKYGMELTNASKGYIAIKSKNRKAVEALEEACKDEENIEVKFLSDMYPSGDERVIIRELLGIELEPGELPSKANAVVDNVETLKNVVLAIEERKPVITKDVTVGGRVKEAIDGSAILNVPIGMPVINYIEQSGGYIKPHGEIVLGGPFTGKHGEENSPVTKVLGGILVAMPFPKEKRKIGVIECECGAQLDRLEEIAEGMDGEIVTSTKCNRMVEVNGRYRCNLPGICPGQAEKVFYLKKHGAEAIIVGTCED